MNDSQSERRARMAEEVEWSTDYDEQVAYSRILRGLRDQQSALRRRNVISSIHFGGL